MRQETALDRARVVLARMPYFKGVRLEDVGLEVLGGALTNISCKVTTNVGAYVLRIAGKGTGEYVDRAAEGYNARMAAAAGVNAEILHFDARDGTMLTRFVEGATMDGESFGPESDTPVRAALALKRVHSMRGVFRSRFDGFGEIDSYLDLLRRLRMPLPEDYYEASREAEAARRALEMSPVPLVPCHNDPWPGNLLEAGGRIYIIDWEYSGMNDPVWDLGDLSVEAGFGPEQDRLMMETYYGGAAPAALYSRLEVYKATSDMHWALWGFVQHANGNPAEDFWAYGLSRLERCRARMGSVDFGQHLAAVSPGRRARSPKRAYRTSPERRTLIHKAPGNV
jgi:thiamine kinase-like enzyme